MEALRIENQQYSPLIDFNLEKGLLVIAGKSYPENTFLFYKPVMGWINRLLAKGFEETLRFEFRLDYLNSSTSKIIFDLLDLFRASVKPVSKIKFVWYYSEKHKDFREIGKEFQSEFPELDFTLQSRVK